MLLLEAQPPTKRSTLRWTAASRLLSLEPHAVLWDSQGALPPCGPGFVHDGHRRESLVPHMLMQNLPVRKALGVAAFTHEKEVKVLPHMAEGSVGILVNNPTVGTEGHLPSMFNYCLIKLPCRWKLVNRNSLSILPGNLRGTTAIRLGAPEPKKVDNAAGRSFVRLSLVYNETQLGLEVNLSGGHSVRRPSSWRIGNQ